MITIHQNFACRLAMIAFGIFVSSLPISATWAASAPNTTDQDWVKERHDWFKHRADRLADRLEIKASQQDAWQAYVKVLEAGMEHPAAHPEIKSDAVSITRARADMASAHAQKLAQIADATAKLQEVLSPEQRKTLDQIADHGGDRHGRHFRDGNRAEDRWDQHGRGCGDGQGHDHQQH